MGRFEDSRQELKKAQDLDPLSLLINTSVGRELYYLRQYEAATQQLKKALDMDPNFVPAQQAMEAAYAQGGMYKEAIAQRQRVLTLSGNPDLAAAIGEDYRKSGYTGVLQGWLEGLSEVSRRGYVSPYNLAQIHARLGEKEQALSVLEQAYTERDSKLSFVKVDPVFDEIRSDARFQQVLKQLSFPD